MLFLGSFGKPLAQRKALSRALLMSTPYRGIAGVGNDTTFNIFNKLWSKGLLVFAQGKGIKVSFQKTLLPGRGLMMLTPPAWEQQMRI